MTGTIDAAHAASTARAGLLTADDEIRLGRLVRTGLAIPAGPDGRPQADHADVLAGRRAEELMARCNIGLARKLARRAVRRRGLDADEAESAAMLGLCRGIRGYDPDFGTRLSTYLWRTIKTALAQLKTPEPSITLDAPADGTSGPLGASLADPRARPPGASAALADEAGRVARALAQLPARWREVIRARSGLGEPGGEPATFAALGRRLGVTHGRVQKLEVKALQRLRELLGAEDGREVMAAEAA
jgi:RNA polymerase sigma factor (sigma-70 family)